MYLHRYSDLFEEASQLSGIPEPLIRLVCNHYFHTVKSKFSNLEYVSIQCPGLGNFYIWTVNFRVELQSIINVMKRKKAQGEPYSQRLLDKFYTY